MSLAFVFPGQGSQSIGMQAELAAAFPVVGETYAEASDVLEIDLWALVQDGPREDLDTTLNTQPVMLTAGVANWRAWQSAGGSLPVLLSGHSLGEYTALVCAGAMAFVDALRLVRRRAELMQDAVPANEGAMAAILGLDEDALMEVCGDASGIGVAEAVNFNSPGQVVVAGHKRAISQLVGLAKEAGARRAVMLPVSVPSHSSLMRPAGDGLVEQLNATELSMPNDTVISAIDAMPYSSAEDIRSRLRKQVFSPVRWVDVIRSMQEKGVTSIAECGPGKVLTGLIKRIDRSIQGACIDTPQALENFLTQVKQETAE